MPKTAYLMPSITNLPTDTWRRLLLHFVNRADRFAVQFYPDELFAADKHAFLALPEATRTPSAAALDGEAIEGPVTPAFRDLLLACTEDPRVRSLWGLTLSRGGEVLLRLEDFTVCLLFVAGDEIGQLHQLGVPASAMELVEPVPRFGPGEQVAPLSDEDLLGLRSQLLNPDHRPDHR